MMLRKDEVMVHIRNVNRKQLMSVHRLNEIVSKLGESHLKAFIEIDSLNGTIRDLEDAIITMGKFHKKHNCGTGKENDKIDEFIEGVKSSRKE